MRKRPDQPPKLRKALDVLHDCTVDSDQTGPGTKNYPPGQIVVPVEPWQAELVKRGVLSSENPDTVSRQRRRIREQLFDKDRIAEYDGLIWAIPV